MPHLFTQKLCLRNSKRHHASITTKTSFTNSTTEVADVQNGPEIDWAKYRELFESQIPNFLNTWFNLYNNENGSKRGIQRYVTGSNPLWHNIPHQKVCPFFSVHIFNVNFGYLDITRYWRISLRSLKSHMERCKSHTFRKGWRRERRSKNFSKYSFRCKLF